MMFGELFQRKEFNIHKLLSYGFRENDGFYTYGTTILDGQFRLDIVLSSNGEVDTSLIEIETGDAYVLYKTGATGTFVGEVRAAVETVLKDVVDCCYDMTVFKSAGTKAVIRYVRETYGDELEFLWKRYPDNAVWRCKDNEKWYGVILTVSRAKLGLDSDERVEIIDLRIQPEKMGELLQNEHYYPGWHMNKKHWYTMILDGSVPEEELYRRIDESYMLARKK